MKLLHFFSQPTNEQKINSSRKSEFKIEIKNENKSSKVIECVKSHLQANNSSYTQQNYTDLFRAAAKRLNTINTSDESKRVEIQALSTSIDDHFSSIRPEFQNLKTKIADSVMDNEVQEVFNSFGDLKLETSFPNIYIYIWIKKAACINNAFLNFNNMKDSQLTYSCSDEDLMRELESL